MYRIVLKSIYYIHFVFERISHKINKWWGNVVSKGCLLVNQVELPTHILFDCAPILRIAKGAKVSIGDYCIIRSGQHSDSIGNRSHSIISVKRGAILKIGNHSGISNTAIHCHNSITIGNNVNIGAGTQIFDTDFHSLDWEDRRDKTDVIKQKTKPVVIGDYVFIGADSIILKGVHIGEKSIIGAGSVVSRDIPSGEIWAGNPAVFIRKINNKEEDVSINHRSDI